MPIYFPPLVNDAAALLDAPLDASTGLNGWFTVRPTDAYDTFPKSAFWVTITAPAGVNREIIWVDARQGNAFQIGSRGQQDTTPRTHAAGALVRVLFTADHYNTLADMVSVNRDMIKALEDAVGGDGTSTVTQRLSSLESSVGSLSSSVSSLSNTVNTLNTNYGVVWPAPPGSDGENYLAYYETTRGISYLSNWRLSDLDDIFIKVNTLYSQRASIEAGPSDAGGAREYLLSYSNPGTAHASVWTTYDLDVAVAKVNSMYDTRALVDIGPDNGSGGLEGNYLLYYTDRARASGTGVSGKKITIQQLDAAIATVNSLDLGARPYPGASDAGSQLYLAFYDSPTSINWTSYWRIGDLDSMQAKVNSMYDTRALCALAPDSGGRLAYYVQPASVGSSDLTISQVDAAIAKVNTMYDTRALAEYGPSDASLNKSYLAAYVAPSLVSYATSLTLQSVDEAIAKVNTMYDARAQTYIGPMNGDGSLKGNYLLCYLGDVSHVGAPSNYEISIQTLDETISHVNTMIDARALVDYNYNGANNNYFVKYTGANTCGPSSVRDDGTKVSFDNRWAWFRVTSPYSACFNGPLAIGNGAFAYIEYHQLNTWNEPPYWSNASHSYDCVRFKGGVTVGPYFNVPWNYPTDCYNGNGLFLQPDGRIFAHEIYCIGTYVYSTREIKEEIADFTGDDALRVIRAASPRRYRLKKPEPPTSADVVTAETMALNVVEQEEGVPSAPPSGAAPAIDAVDPYVYREMTGLVLEEAPTELTSGAAIDVYALATVALAAAKELDAQLQVLRSELASLKAQLAA